MAGPNRNCAAIAALALLALSACGEGTVIDVVVDGDMSVEGCDDLTPWRPGFATYVRSASAPGVMRFQNFAGAASFEDDAIAFIISDPETLSERAGETLVVGDRDAGDDAEAQWTWHGSCFSEAGLSASLQGDLVFDAPPRRDGELVEGTFSGSAVDSRDPQVVYAPDLTISIRFTYRTSVPYQVYAAQ